MSSHTEELGGGCMGLGGGQAHKTDPHQWDSVPHRQTFSRAEPPPGGGGGGGRENRSSLSRRFITRLSFQVTSTMIWFVRGKWM